MFQISHVVRIVVTLSLLLSLASSGYAAKLLQTYGSNRYTAAQYSPDGSRLLAQDAAQVHVFDATTQQKLYALPKQMNSIRYVFQSTQTLVMAGAGDKVLRRFDVATGNELSPLELPVAVEHIEFVDTDHALIYGAEKVSYIQLDPMNVVWSRTRANFTLAPDGTSFSMIEQIEVLYYGNGYVRIENQPCVFTYSTATGDAISSSSIYNSISCLAYGPTGQVLYIAANGRHLFQLDATTGASVRDIYFSAYRKPTLPTQLSFIDNQHLVGVDGAGRLFTADVTTTDGQPVLINDGITYRSMAVSSDCSRIVATRTDGNVEEWNYPALTLRATYTASSLPQLNDQIALSPDGNYVVAGQQDGQLLVFDALSGDLLHTWQGHFSADSVFGLAINNSPLLITSGTQAVLMNLHTGAMEHLLACPVGRFSADGHTVAVTNHATPNQFQIYDTLSGNQVAAIDTGLTTSLEIKQALQTKALIITDKNYATYDFLFAPDGKHLFPRINTENEHSVVETTVPGSAWYTHKANPTCVNIDLPASQLRLTWNGPSNGIIADTPVSPPNLPTGLLKPSLISADGKVLGFDYSLIATKTFTSIAKLPKYGAALDEKGSLVLIQPDVSVFNLYDVSQTAVVDRLNYGIQCPTLSSYQNRLLFIANGIGYLCDLERTTETQIGGVHLHPLIDADGTFAPGQVLRVVWNLNLQTAGTAAQLELVNAAHPAQSFVLAQAWAPYGAATTWVTLPDKLYSGRYILRARSVWNNVLYVDSAPLTIAGNNGADNWTQYE